MVDEISNYAQVAPNRQEPARPAPPREVERQGNSTRNNRDTVSISREAQELLAEEARSESTRDAVEAERTHVEGDLAKESRIEESEATVQAERERIKAAREENIKENAERKRAEVERIREGRDKEPAESAEEAENSRTRA